MNVDEYRFELAKLTDRALDAGVSPAEIRSCVVVAAVCIAYSKSDTEPPGVGERSAGNRFRISEELE